MVKYIEIKDRFIIINKIGNGTYGEVYHVISKYNIKNITEKKDYALKISLITDYDIIDSATLKELSQLSKFDHKNIIKVHDIFLGCYEYRNYVCILMDLGISTIRKYGLHNVVTQEKKNIFKFVLEGLNYIHTAGYCHGDLSLSNIIYDYTGNIQIIDFGFSNRLYRNFDETLPPTFVARPIEFICKEGYHNDYTKVDSWSLGCVLYYLMTNTLLFTDKSTPDAINEIIKKCGHVDKKLIGELEIKSDIEIYNLYLTNMNIPYDMKGLLAHMLQYDYTKRLNITSIYNIYNNITPDNKQSIISNIEKHDNIKNDVPLINPLKIVTFILKYIKSNNLEDEVLFLTLTNMHRIKYNDKIMRNANNDYVIISIIMFWLVNKIISVETLEFDDIKKITDEYKVGTFGDNYNINIREIHQLLCIELNWNIDQHTSYNNIINIPTEYHQYYKIIYFVMITNSEFYKYDESIKSITIYKILQMYFKFDILTLQEFIKNCSNNYSDINEVDKCYEHFGIVLHNILNNDTYIDVYIDVYNCLLNYMNDNCINDSELWLNKVNMLTNRTLITT